MGGGGRTPARACRSSRPTEADSPREDFENSSIYPSRRLDTVEQAFSSGSLLPVLIRVDAGLRESLSELQHRLDRGGKPVVLVAAGHMRRVLLDVVGGVAHRKRDAAFGKHWQVVLHVADGRDRVG